MPALTTQYVMDLESDMQIITEREYNRLASNLWWPKITKLRKTMARRDIVMWLLSTATIKDQGKGGNIAFDDLVMQYTEIENRYSGAGLKLMRGQLEDTDGNGVDLASQWSGDIGAYMAYWPQKQVATLLKTGHTGSVVSYDKVPFFGTNHPINPFASQYGTYGNLLTGSASGSYPGACPVDVSVAPDVALDNLGKIFAYFTSIKMPNGEDPRFLRPAAILCSPRLFPRLVQLTEAKFLAQAAGSGAASADVSAVIKALGYATPIMCDELAGFENDTTFFVIAENIGSTQLGGVIYTEREAYKINYYGTVDQAQLSRSQELEWHCHGRNVVSPGHPYLVFKCKGS
jgi:phage major head subunit gpT-like protein